jgi:hypothetical protein
VRRKGTTSPQGTPSQPSPPRRRGSRCDGKEPRHLKAPPPNRHPREGGGPGATERNHVTSRRHRQTVAPAKAGVQVGCDEMETTPLAGATAKPSPPPVRMQRNGNDANAGHRRQTVAPAKAGVQSGCDGMETTPLPGATAKPSPPRRRGSNPGATEWKRHHCRAPPPNRRPREGGGPVRMRRNGNDATAEHHRQTVASSPV